jgi:hypothetical protein
MIVPLPGLFDWRVSRWYFYSSVRLQSPKNALSERWLSVPDRFVVLGYDPRKSSLSWSVLMEVSVFWFMVFGIAIPDPLW